VELASAAMTLLPWGDVGYLGRKDYSMAYPTGWFRALAQIDGGAWRVEGVELLATSREASRTGVNRMASSTDDVVLTSACGEGPAAAWALVGDPHLDVDPHSPSLLRGLLVPLGRPEVRADYGLSLWAFVIGSRRWSVHDERAEISSTRAAIAEAQVSLGRTSLDNELSAMDPGEYLTDAGAIDPQPEVHEPTAEYVSSMCLASKWDAVAEAVERAVEAKALNRDEVLDAAR